MEKFDIAVLGAGAAGLMCAAVAGQLGRRVVVLDHAKRIAEKIRISGGGRCNFTNRDAGPAAFLSDNPRFCRSALARYTPADFIALLNRHGVRWHEKHRGQLFCDDSSEQVIEVLRRECAAGQVAIRHPVEVRDYQRESDGSFLLHTDAGPLAAPALVIATGGLSIPKIGASDFAYRLAERFGLRVVSPTPALVPLTFTAQWDAYAALAGLSVEAGVSTGAGASAGRFVEDLLFTHRGLSGPAILQISSYWRSGEPIVIDLAPGRDLAAWLIGEKHGARRSVATMLADAMPARLVATALSRAGVTGDARLADLPDRALRALGAAVNAWQVLPAGTEGWRKAEVTRGGVDTRDLSSSTLAARAVPGLYFVGEAVDVTGWLGGYNFQWAWASGVAAARAAAEQTRAA
ncbi:BaiN/RdsA family NAD(P)/FAD-dependent oxidoreductase [Chitinasiproducens palmae]|nr:NAD(P)/FAD-dependent oxidoreductase [Chitinasiproducens palmae]